MNTTHSFVTEYGNGLRAISNNRSETALLGQRGPLGRPLDVPRTKRFPVLEAIADELVLEYRCILFSTRPFPVIGASNRNVRPLSISWRVSSGAIVRSQHRPVTLGRPPRPVQETTLPIPVLVVGKKQTRYPRPSSTFPSVRSRRGCRCFCAEHGFRPSPRHG